MENDIKFPFDPEEEDGTWQFEGTFDDIGEIIIEDDLFVIDDVGDWDNYEREDFS